MKKRKGQTTPPVGARWWPVFFAGVRAGLVTRRACEAAKICRDRVYDLKSRAEAVGEGVGEPTQAGAPGLSQADRTALTFMAEWRAARADAAELLEEEARRLAQEGDVQLKFFEGAPVMIPNVRFNPDRPKGPENREMVPYVERVRYPQVLMFLLRAYAPETFKAVELAAVASAAQQLTPEIVIQKLLPRPALPAAAAAQGGGGGPRATTS